MKKNKQNNKANTQPNNNMKDMTSKPVDPMIGELQALNRANLAKVPPVPAPAKKAPAKKVLPKGMTHDKGLLLSVFAIQNPSRNRACNDHTMQTIIGLAPEGCMVIRNKGNLLIRKGPATGPHPYFLAHMDQVHDYVPFMKVRVSGNLLHAVDGNDAQTGVGGDDKCGIYLALLMLARLDHCTAVFVRDEEVGCLGSAEVPLSWFDAAAFVIQADRNNRSMDIIRDTNGMTCASDAFMDGLDELPIVCAAGHTENTGSVTDIGELSGRGLPVSMVNISSGYHNPHSHTEVVHLDELGIACQLAFEAASLMGMTCWHHIPESQYFGGKSWDYPTRKGGGSTYGGYASEEWMPRSEEQEATFEEEQDAKLREATIRKLVDEYLYDREFDCLDVWETEDLLDLLDACEDKHYADFRPKK